MNILTLDCEFNQPSGKTIQIGAAVFTVNGVLLERFETYVNPGEPITEFITQLTGITDMNVSNAPNIREAYEMLEYIHAKHKCFVNPLVWGSGVRNDSLTIWTESGVDRPNFMGFRVLDVKSIYQCINMVQGKTIRGGLESSCKKAGIGFEGRSHTALADAVNTFRLWQHLMKGFKMGDVFQFKRDEVLWERKYNTMSMIELMEEMVKYKADEEKDGLSLQMMGRGIVLFPISKLVAIQPK